METAIRTRIFAFSHSFTQNTKNIPKRNSLRILRELCQYLSNKEYCISFKITISCIHMALLHYIFGSVFLLVLRVYETLALGVAQQSTAKLSSHWRIALYLLMRDCKASIGKCFLWNQLGLYKKAVTFSVQ